MLIRNGMVRGRPGALGQSSDNKPVSRPLDSKARTVTKAVIWTLLGLMVMAFVGWVMTGSWRVGGAMAGINAAVGFVTYFLYERLWSVIRWGRQDA